MSQFCQKILKNCFGRLYILDLQGLNMQTTTKTLIFDNFFFLSDYGRDRYRFGAFHPGQEVCGVRLPKIFILEANLEPGI